jgi:hypothetical protein
MEIWVYVSVLLESYLIRLFSNYLNLLKGISLMCIDYSTGLFLAEKHGRWDFGVTNDFNGSFPRKSDWAKRTSLKWTVEIGLRNQNCKWILKRTVKIQLG